LPASGQRSLCSLPLGPSVYRDVTVALDLVYCSTWRLRFAAIVPRKHNAGCKQAHRVTKLTQQTATPSGWFREPEARPESSVVAERFGQIKI
jgi:hypothetical protein